jgi:hypothetical protein
MSKDDSPKAIDELIGNYDTYEDYYIELYYKVNLDSENEKKDSYFITN